MKSLGLNANADDVRVYATNAAQPWHVDDADLVALLCLKRAKAGGLRCAAAGPRRGRGASRWARRAARHVRAPGPASTPPPPASLLPTRSGWASSLSIYNRLLETRPDLVQELTQTYAGAAGGRMCGHSHCLQRGKGGSSAAVGAEPSRRAAAAAADKKGEVGPGEKPYLKLPVLSEHQARAGRAGRARQQLCTGAAGKPGWWAPTRACSNS